MNNIIYIPSDFVTAWRQNWPCSGLADRSHTIHLDENGDLVDYYVDEDEGYYRDRGVDGRAFNALLTDYLYHMTVDQATRNGYDMSDVAESFSSLRYW